MATLAYVLLPVTGMLSYFFGKDARARLHGLQAVVLGTVWPLALYGASAIGAATTRLVFLGGAAVWLVFLVGTAIGRDPAVPGLRSSLRRLAAAPPRS